MDQKKDSFLKELRNEKGITSAPLLILILAYNGTVYLSQSKITKVKRIIIIGIIYLIAMVIAIIFFIIMPPIF